MAPFPPRPISSITMRSCARTAASAISEPLIASAFVFIHPSLLLQTKPEFDCGRVALVLARQCGQRIRHQNRALRRLIEAKVSAGRRNPHIANGSVPQDLEHHCDTVADIRVEVLRPPVLSHSFTQKLLIPA